MIRIFALAIAFALVIFCATVPTILLAQSSDASDTSQTTPKIDKRKLIVPPRNADGTLIMTPFFEDPIQWVKEKQREFYGAMSGRCVT